jgi:hypothetical protein
LSSLEPDLIIYEVVLMYESARKDFFDGKFEECGRQIADIIVYLQTDHTAEEEVI